MANGDYIGRCSVCGKIVVEPGRIIYDSLLRRNFCSNECMHEYTEDIDYRDLMKD